MQTFLIIWRILLPPKDRQIDNLNLVYTLNLVIWVQYGYNKLKKILLTFSHPWHSVEHFVWQYQPTSEELCSEKKKI